MEFDPELEESEDEDVSDDLVVVFFFGAVRRTDVELLPHPASHRPAHTARRSMPPTMMAQKRFFNSLPP